MTSKYIKKIIPKKILKSCFKFVFLTKKFKEKNQHHVKLFKNEMIMNTKMHNIVDIIEISKSMEPNKCTHQIFYENIYLQVFYDF
jgi:hypothetical protein